MNDDEARENIVAQTAQLRYSIRSEGLRNLMRQRGVDPQRCIQISCDQGDDVCLGLVCPDGVFVEAEYREHYKTRQAIGFVDWSEQSYSDSEIELCRRMLANENEISAFDAAVREYYDEHIARDDSHLPPLKWGDRIWHLFEDGPPT